MIASTLDDDFLNSLSKTEQVTFRLIQADLIFINTAACNASKSSTIYMIALLPYMGLMIHGCERWAQKVHPIKDYIGSFSDDEKKYYTELRMSIKLWETPFPDLFAMLKKKYDESDSYFSNCCKPIAKTLQLYNIYGAYLINDVFCDNTILDMIFVPGFEMNHIDSELIKNMAMIAGKIMAKFGVTNEITWDTNPSLYFKNKDFGGIFKSPVGNSFSSKFVLFSIYCSTNFVIYGVNEYIIQDIPIKLRVAYIMYFYLLKQIPQINTQLKTNFHMDNRWIDKEGTFRNCMAHYGIGAALSQNEVIEEDAFGGLTQKMFQQEWIPLKNLVIKELSQFSKQIGLYLGI